MGMGPDEYIEQALRRTRAMAAAAIWDRPPKVNPRGWLANFEAGDRFAAAIVLDRLVYVSEATLEGMVYSALMRLLASRRRPGDTVEVGSQRAEDFIAQACWTFIEGEDPNITDSGYKFCRMTRKWVDEDLMVSPDVAAAEAARGRPVVFLDDFIGSGEQLRVTWKRHFEAIAAFTNFEAHYVCPVATQYGLDRIAKLGIPVSVWPCNIMTARDSINGGAMPPFVSEAEARGRVEELLRKYGPRLDVSATLSDPESRKFGFHSLGLTLAFHHKVPDATIPLIYRKAGPNWTVLVETT